MKHDISKVKRSYIGEVIIYRLIEGMYEVRREIGVSEYNYLNSKLGWFRANRKAMKEQLRVARMLDELLGTEYED